MVPDRVRPALVGALRQETAGKVLSRLLWMPFRVLDGFPDDFLAALAAGAVPRWDDRLVAGPALAILG
jgi:hypothetical protein